MLRAAINDGSDAPQQDVPEAGPVFVVVVKEESNPGVGKNVADSSEIDGPGALGLPVYDGIQSFTVQGVAEGDEVRRAGGIGGGKTGNGAFVEEASDFGGEGQGLDSRDGLIGPGVNYFDSNSIEALNISCCDGDAC